MCGVTGVEPTTEPMPTAEPTTAPSNDATATPEPVQDAVPLSDVLWIGGAILAVLIAGLVTFLILGRRARKNEQ